RVYQELYQFCVVDLSSVYFDVLKDRLYTSARTSPERRSGQTALHDILVALVKMFAPILCHTTEEVWEHLPAPEAPSVHLALWPQAEGQAADPKWERLLGVRAQVLRELEKLRAGGAIGKSLEAMVAVHSADPETLRALQSTDLTALFIVSDAKVSNDPVGPECADLKGLSIRAEKSTFAKCDRCWNLRADVGGSPLHPSLCGRCVKVLG
ncbi:MAG TPA: class I tRNA ligase family protein, partial [Planctomycetota bacterium]|nr:class I tRNA ligase family protein [Planctomycetota bacterium]